MKKTIEERKIIKGKKKTKERRTMNVRQQQQRKTLAVAAGTLGNHLTEMIVGASDELTRGSGANVVVSDDGKMLASSAPTSDCIDGINMENPRDRECRQVQV
jgi:hypothetical protein